MNIKNIVLFHVIIAVLVAAVVGILYVAESITKSNAVDILTKAGWIILIVAVVMIIINLIRRN